MSKQMCLKWNHHTSNLIEYFNSLLSTEVFADVTLACDGLSLKAHKIVLSACSPFFKTLFLENPSKHPIVIMKDIKFCDLKALLKFIYSGEVSISRDQLSSFLLTAETLKVMGLEKITADNRQALGIGKQSNAKQSKVPNPTSLPLTDSAKITSPLSLLGKNKTAGIRKRPLINSNRSDEEGISAKMKAVVSSDVEELSDDSILDITSDIRENSGPSSIFMVSLPLQHNIHGFTSANNATPSKTRPSKPRNLKKVHDIHEPDVEPSNLLEQTLTVEKSPVKKRNTGPVQLSSNLGISRESICSDDGSSQIIVPDILSDPNLTVPDSPPDIKPDIVALDDFLTSPVAGLSHSSARSKTSNEHLNTSLKFSSSNSKEHKSTAKKRVRQRRKQSDNPNSVSRRKSESWKQILHMCSDCSYTNASIEELMSHIEYHEKPAVECGFCKGQFTELLESSNDELAVECDICNHCFCSRVALLTHKVWHH